MPVEFLSMTLYNTNIRSNELRVMPTCSVCAKIKPEKHFIGRRGKLCKSCKACRERFRRHHETHRLKHTYGIDRKTYEQMYQDQGGVCKICSQPCTQALAVDHDHETGEIRGLLCRACNTGLGLFKDNPALLQNALDYLGDR